MQTVTTIGLDIANKGCISASVSCRFNLRNTNNPLYGIAVLPRRSVRTKDQPKPDCDQERHED